MTAIGSLLSLGSAPFAMLLFVIGSFVLPVWICCFSSSDGLVIERVVGVVIDKLVFGSTCRWHTIRGRVESAV